MHLHRLFPAGVLGLLLAVGFAAADSPDATRPGLASPLRLIPDVADFALEIHKPGQLVGGMLKLDVVERMQKLPVVAAQLNSTNVRRLRQLLAYFEKQLGAKYPELLDDIAGGGMALAGKFGDKAPAVLVLQGRNEKRVAKFLSEALSVLEGELKRQESKDKITKGTYEGVAGYKIGDLLVARLGSALVASNNKDALAGVIRLHSGKDSKSLDKKAEVIAARQLRPENALASAWINMKPVQASQAGKDLYATPRDNAIFTSFIGGYLSVLGRTPFVCAGLTLDKDQLQISIRAPRGRDGSGADGALHIGNAKQTGSRPLLEPKGVLYSTSFYFDLNTLWTQRGKLFPKAQLGGLENANKASPLALGGIRMEKLFAAAAPYHRFVATSVAKSPYKSQPGTGLPAFAYVIEMKDAERFGKAAEAGLRFAGIAATGTFKMKLVEQMHGEHKIVGYRFDEKAVVPQDSTGIRYNFTPCFTRVGNQFVVSSRLELCRDLIDELIVEQKSPARTNAKSVRDRVYAAGLAQQIRDNQDPLITQAILDQAVSPEEAKKQVRQAIALVNSLGSFTLSSLYKPERFRYDITLRLQPIKTNAEVGR